MAHPPDKPKEGHLASQAPARPEGGRLAPRSTPDAVASFLAEARAVTPAPGGRGRLIFALDATMSRQQTWDTACRLQAEMFLEAGKAGGLDVQLLYYRGFGECRASRWVADARALADLMTGITCRGGQTQIGKVLSHARRETQKQRVQALVFVGDAMEESIDNLAARAGELGLLGVPMFLFQEGRDRNVEAAFRELARLTGGAYARFDNAAADELASLLRAVAAYATGGRKALADQRQGAARLLLEQLR